MSDLPVKPPGDQRFSATSFPTAALLAAVVTEFIVYSVMFFHTSGPVPFRVTELICLLLIILPAVIYWLLESRHPIGISRLHSEMILCGVLAALAAAWVWLAVKGLMYGGNWGLALLTVAAIWLADLAVLILIFALLRRTGRSAWWACFWLFSVGVLAEGEFTFWLPATALLLATLLAYGSRLRRWSGIFLALSTLACPCVVPVVFAGGVGIWRDKNNGRIGGQEAAFIVGSFMVMILAATGGVLLWPAALHTWVSADGIKMSYVYWPLVQRPAVLSHRVMLWALSGAAWLLGVVTVASVALRGRWSVPRTALHLCVLSLIFCPVYDYLLLLPVLALGTLAWNRSAFWLCTVVALLVGHGASAFYLYPALAVLAGWLLWSGAVVLEIVQIVVDIKGSGSANRGRPIWANASPGARPRMML